MDYTSFEINNMGIERLFVMQKILLNQLGLELNNPLYDKNDIFFKLQEIETINLVIDKKLKNDKRKK